MPQKITTRYQALVDTAEREIETLSVEEALALFGRDDVTFIDSPYHNRFLRKTSALSSLASAACVRRWRRKGAVHGSASGRAHQRRIWRVAQCERPVGTAVGQAELGRFPQDPHKARPHLTLRFHDMRLESREFRQIGCTRQ
jgi:hypothetical protein